MNPTPETARSTRYDEFPFPQLPDSAENPKWIGAGFSVGALAKPILVYSEAESHWSPELTTMHEQEAGSHHPIDCASRDFAFRNLRAFTPGEAPFVMDVGCSSGFLIDELKQRWPQCRPLGADYIAPPLLTLAKRLTDVPILQFDLRAAPLPDECLHAVTALNVLEHVDDDAQALREIARMLKPGGIAHLEIPANPDLFDIYDEKLMHHRRYRLNELVEKVKAAGLQVLKATHLGVGMYPAFYWVKKRNRRLMGLSAEEKEKIVSRQIRQSGRSRILDLLLKGEMLAGRYVNYPFGIRCVVLCRKES